MVLAIPLGHDSMETFRTSTTIIRYPIAKQLSQASLAFLNHTLETPLDLFQQILEFGEY